MRKNRLIALIGTLTMAAAGLAAVSAGVSSKKADSVNAANVYSVTFTSNISNFSGWGGISDYYVHINGLDWLCDKEKMTVSGNTASVSFTLDKSSTINTIVFALKQNGTVKQSHDISISITSSDDQSTYTVVNNPGGWDENKWTTGSSVSKTSSKTNPSSTLNTYYVYDKAGISVDSTFYVYGFGEPSTVKSMYWPGETGTSNAYAKLTEDSAHTGKSIYKVQLSESYTKLIMNNNAGKQTVDVTDLAGNEGRVIRISTNKTGDNYNYEWIDYSELDIADGYWVRNENGTLLTHLEIDPNDSSQYTGTVALEAGDEFKIVNRIGYKIDPNSYYGYSTQLEDYDGSARHAGQLVVGNADSIKVSDGNSGTYTVYLKFGRDTNKICIPALVKHSVTYVGGTGATGTAPTQADVAEGVNFEVASNTFEKNGYSFVNWSDGNDAYDAGDSYTMGTSNVTLTAQWSAGTYEVELDNGAGSGDSSVTATFDDDMPDVTVPELDDNDFRGYYTGSNGTGVQYYDEFGKSAHVYNDLNVVKLYAKWESSVVRHTVTFVSDDTDYGTVDVTQLSVVDGTAVTVDDNKIIIGDTTITATPASDKGDHYIYEFKSWYTSGYLAEIPETIDDDYEFTATFIRKGEPHTITLINTDERGGSYPITQKYDPNGYDVTESVINEYTHGNPLGRTYVGLKLDATDPDETPFTHVVWDDDYEYYICYAFNNAACYEYSFDGSNFYPFTSHRDSAVGEPGYLQVYCVDGVNVTSGDTLTVRYRENEQSAYQTLTLDIDQSSNLAANGKVRNTASNTYLNVRFIYNESTQSYSYEATLGGMPDSGHWLAIDGVLYQVEQNPSNPDELQVLNVSIGNNQIVKMYHGQTSTWYTCSLDSASQGTWTAVTDGLQCGEPRAYNVYIKQSTPGNYDVLYFGYGQLTPEEEARKFAHDFLTEMSKVCKLEDDGHGNIIVNTVEAELQAAWSKMAGIFGTVDPETGISNAAKALLRAASPVERSENVLERFASSYNYIYGKYSSALTTSGANFLGRDVPTFGNSRLFSVSEVSTSTLIIASVAIVGIAAVGVFFIYRKRKEN